MSVTRTIAYADGSSRGNPGPGGWGALVVTPDEQVIELGGAAPHTTNNRMEMMAAIEVLVQIQNVAGPVELRTDSSYLINGITMWVHGWRKRGWQTIDGKDVLNRDLWEMLSRLTGERGSANRVQWRHVRGHAGEPGNERVDAIATGFATAKPPLLYRGPLAAYDVAIDLTATNEPTSPGTRPPAPPSRSRSSGGRPYSYLSLVGGVAQRHATWAECEKRVRGVSAARFKKAMSREDESAILRAWGLRGDEI